MYSNFIVDIERIKKNINDIHIPSQCFHHMYYKCHSMIQRTCDSCLSSIIIYIFSFFFFLLKKNGDVEHIIRFQFQFQFIQLFGHFFFFKLFIICNTQTYTVYIDGINQTNNKIKENERIDKKKEKKTSLCSARMGNSRNQK